MTIYNQKTHDQLVDKIFSNGEGLFAFCAEAGIKRATFFTWLKKYSSFKEAYDIAKEKGARIWEQYPKNAMEQGKNFNMKYWQIIMSNRYHYKSLNSLAKIKDATNTDEKYAAMWVALAEGKLSTKEFFTLSSAIAAQLKAKELEIKQKELELKQKEVENQKSLLRDLGNLSDDFVTKVMALKEGKADIVYLGDANALKTPTVQK